MINVDNLKAPGKAPNCLSPLYPVWIAQVVQEPFHQEAKATFVNYVICHPTTTAVKLVATYFHLEIK